MKRAFVDTGAFFAHLVVEDLDHSAAREVFARAETERWRLLTTNAVVSESYTLLLTRARNGRALALGMLDALESGFCHVERASERDEHRAVDLLRSHDDKAYSFCDALSFAVMERMDLSDAIAFDRHFREYGRFNVLP